MRYHDVYTPYEWVIQFWRGTNRNGDRVNVLTDGDEALACQPTLV